MMQVTMTRDMRPFQKHGTATLPDDVAERLVAAGDAVDMRPWPAVHDAVRGGTGGADAVRGGTGGADAVHGGNGGAEAMHGGASGAQPPPAKRYRTKDAG